MSAVTLGEVVREARPGFASGKSDDDGYVQIRMNNIGTDGGWNFQSIRRVPRADTKLSRFAVEPGDILFNATNSPDLVGKSALFVGYEEPVVYSNHFLRLRLDRQRAEPAYVARWLQAKRSEGVFTALCKQWVNQASIEQQRLMALTLPLPMPAEQRRIAAILDQADALRAKRRAALAHLDEMAQAIFVEMFGDPRTNTKGLPVGPLSGLGTLDRGVSKHRPRNDPDLLGGRYPFIQTGDVSNCAGYIESYQATYSEKGFKQSKMWPAGTLCITIAANIAKVGILTFDACFPDSVVAFQGRSPATTEYVRLWFSFVREHLEQIAPESTQKNINLAILRSFPIATPEQDDLEVFSERLKAVTTLQRGGRQAYETANALFASLQHRAFTGAL